MARASLPAMRAHHSKLVALLLLAGCATQPQPAAVALAEPPLPTYDLAIRNGTIYDGTGGTPYTGDVLIDGDKIVAAGPAAKARGRSEIDASGLAVAPGFINMLSWATESLIADGRGQSDIR